MLCAFSWAACPGMWEGKVRSALAHVWCAVERLLRCPLQLTASVFAFSLLNLHPKILRLLSPASYPLTQPSQAAFTWAMLPSKELGSKIRTLLFLYDQDSLMTVNGTLIFDGEITKQLNKKQWDRMQKGNL